MSELNVKGIYCDIEKNGELVCNVKKIDGTIKIVKPEVLDGKLKMNLRSLE